MGLLSSLREIWMISGFFAGVLFPVRSHFISMPETRSRSNSLLLGTFPLLAYWCTVSGHIPSCLAISRIDPYFFVAYLRSLNMMSTRAFRLPGPKSQEGEQPTFSNFANMTFPGKALSFANCSMYCRDTPNFLASAEQVPYLLSANFLIF